MFSLSIQLQSMISTPSQSSFPNTSHYSLRLLLTSKLLMLQVAKCIVRKDRIHGCRMVANILARLSLIRLFLIRLRISQVRFLSQMAHAINAGILPNIPPAQNYVHFLFVIPTMCCSFA